jgi:hypothetical protein
MPIDPNEAPPGYEAVAFHKSCDDCALFGKENDKLCNDSQCTADKRKDKTSVVFVKKAAPTFPVLDPNEAPVGYKAVEVTTNGCSGCAFSHFDGPEPDKCPDRNGKAPPFCTPRRRADCCAVVFVKDSVAPPLPPSIAEPVMFTGVIEDVKLDTNNKNLINRIITGTSTMTVTLVLHDLNEINAVINALHKRSALPGLNPIGIVHCALQGD